MSAPSLIRVLVVDDSTFVRRAFRRVLDGAADVEWVGEAADGEAGVEAVRALRPDVVLLDLDLPVMDGLAALEVLRTRHPQLAVIVVSGAAKEGASITREALEAGAVDVVDKSAVQAMAFHELAQQVLRKIRGAAQQGAPTPVPAPSGRGPELLVMGASTGGPQALFEVISALPEAWPTPIVVVQHISAPFLEPLARRVNDYTPFVAHLARGGETLTPGRVYFPASGRDAVPERREEGLVLVRRPAAPSTPHVPSVDALFFGAARACGRRAWGVLLTGMGRDGAEGLLEIRRQGGLTVAQDEATSAVYGMPREAARLEAAAQVVPLNEIAAALTRAADVEGCFTPGPISGPVSKESP